mgnify:CR=1 FL=1
MAPRVVAAHRVAPVHAVRAIAGKQGQVALVLVGAGVPGVACAGIREAAGGVGPIERQTVVEAVQLVDVAAGDRP